MNTMVKRNQSIDLLKGICILFVITTHFNWSERETLYGGFPFWIVMAVPVFILISGYVYTNSYLRKNVETLDQAFSIEIWFKSFLRYTIPFLIVYIIEVIINIILTALGRISIPWYDYLAGIFIGGWGPGSYYFPVMIQFLFFFPFIFIAIKKFGWKALVGFFIFNLFFEIIKFPFQISAVTYRLLIFRYTFLIASGCYFAFLHSREANDEKPSNGDKAVKYILWGGGVNRMYIPNSNPI